jgi:hypothetical protein
VISSSKKPAEPPSPRSEELQRAISTSHSGLQGRGVRADGPTRV